MSKAKVSVEGNTITKLVVCLSRNKLLAFARPNLTFEYDCSISQDELKTVPGYFRIFKKETMHLGHAFGAAPMPYSMYFNKSGSAIHGTPVAVRSKNTPDPLLPVEKSEACFGLSNDDAKAIFEATPMNTIVQVMK